MCAMKRRALGLAVLPLAVVVGLLTPAPSASAAVGPYTTWAMTSDAGDYILAGHAYSYDAGSGMQLHGTSTGVSGSVDGWNFSIEPADGDTLQAGRTYAGATRTPFHQSTEPGVELYGHGRGCNTLTGSFTVQELSFDLAGELESLGVSFVQHCEGDAPAAYGSIAWHASTPAPPLPPSLTLKVSGKHARYGQKVTAQVQLAGGAAGSVVSVYARTSDGKERLVTQGAVDAGGHLAASLKVTETTTFVARFKGGGTLPDREDEATLTVAGKLRSAFLDKAPKSGKFRLYKYTRDATVGSLLLPNHKGDCLTFHIQLQARGAWGYDTVTKCLKLNRNSAVGIRIPGDKRAVGIPVRIRSEWKGDDRNTAANGTWLYLKFTT